MNWLTLIEHLAGDEYLFHGTSEVAWDEMRRENALRDLSHRGTISFTWSRRVAEEFARLRARADTDWSSDEEGIVLVFNKTKLDRDFELESFADEGIGSEWSIQNEREIRALTDIIPDLKSYLVRSYRVHRASYDDPMAFNGEAL